MHEYGFRRATAVEMHKIDLDPSPLPVLRLIGRGNKFLGELTEIKLILRDGTPNRPPLEDRKGDRYLPIMDPQLVIGRNDWEHYL